MDYTHKDCKHFLAVDVFKGICKRDQDNILADDSSCDRFDLLERCKYCKNYKATQEQLGLCMDTVDAYPDMIAKTCNDFQWRSHQA